MKLHVEESCTIVVDKVGTAVIVVSELALIDTELIIKELKSLENSDFSSPSLENSGHFEDKNSLAVIFNEKLNKVFHVESLLVKPFKNKRRGKNSFTLRGTTERINEIKGILKKNGGENSE